MKRTIVGAAALGTAFAMSSCEQQQAEQPYTELTYADVVDAGAAIITPGQTVILEATTDNRLKKDLISKIGMVSFSERHGFEDKNAPYVSTLPIRVDAWISDVPEPSDLACDTYNVSKRNRHENVAQIALLSLSNSKDDYIQVSWANDVEGAPGDHLIACYIDGKEVEDGLIMAFNDQPAQ
jgi:hypothetical protein